MLKKFLLIHVLIFYSPLLSAQEVEEKAKSSAFSAANSPGSIGETGTLFLVKPGIFARPIYNDVVGETDKYLSQATQLGYLTNWNDHSFVLIYNWRFMTPANKTSFGTPDLKNPIGRYADWIELQGGWAHLFTVDGQLIRWQISLGVGNIGDHGAKFLQRAVHKAIGGSLFGTDYEDQPAGTHGTYGTEIGLVEDRVKIWSNTLETLLSLGISYNKFMTDFYFSQNHVITHSENFQTAIETRLLRQFQSIGYQNQQLASRFEFSLGWRYHWYRPSIKYLSPFLKGDPVGQVYVDLIAFTIAL